MIGPAWASNPDSPITVARNVSMICFFNIFPFDIIYCRCVKVKVKVKVWTLAIAPLMSQTRDHQRFTISEVAADWHEPMVPQRIM